LNPTLALVSGYGDISPSLPTTHELRILATTRERKEKRKKMKEE